MTQVLSQQFVNITGGKSHQGMVYSKIIPYFFCLSNTVALRDILNEPYAVFLENGTQQKIHQLLESPLIQSADFCVSLTTASAYHHQSALCIAACIMQRFTIHPSKYADIETCLQEAIINAIVHGNLAIHNRPTTVDMLDQYYHHVEKRLQSQSYCARRITLCAWNSDTHLTLSVSDEGKGFSCDAGLPVESLPHGRGLYLIRSITERAWIGNDRCTLFMTFSH